MQHLVLWYSSSILDTPTGQLLHHAISSKFRTEIHFFDATLICLCRGSVVYLSFRSLVVQSLADRRRAPSPPPSQLVISSHCYWEF